MPETSAIGKKERSDFIAVGNEIGYWNTILEALRTPHLVRTAQIEAAYQFAKVQITALQHRMQELWLEETADTSHSR